MKPENYPQSPKAVWDIFYDFTQIPRPSKKEEKICEYLVNLAKDNGLKYVVDKVQNVIIYVPGKNGREADGPVLIQNHIDMVTDALPDKVIDFENDPIDVYVDGDWLKARGTTLGADNGIGCAAALAPIFDKEMVHPPLELLFTVDEETGLNGALGLEAKYLTAKKMLNLDTEEWGSLYIGCAGGIDYELTKKYTAVEPKIKNMIKVQIEDFLGGHSGVDIHEQKGNALKCLAEFLLVANTELEIEISEIRGGKAHNIIPRDAFAIINVKEEDISKLEQIQDLVLKKWKSYLPKEDRKSLFVNSKVTTQNKVLSGPEATLLVDYMNLFPHGAHAYDLEDSSLVSMSNNFAKFLVVGGEVYTQSSLRFFDREEVKTIENQLRVLGRQFGMNVESHSEYPSWKPERENSVLDLLKDTYRELYGKEAVVTAIHAGLECGIIRDKIGPIDVASFGPTIMGAHSPDERIQISTVEKFWDLLKAVLAKI